MDDLPYLRGLTVEQTEAVTDPARLLCIVAGPGSGKTTVLTRRIAFRGMDPEVAPKNTVAITFTNQAADELKARLAGLSMYELPWIGTFHSFAFLVLRRYLEELRRPVPHLITSKARLITAAAREDASLWRHFAKSGSDGANGLASTLAIGELTREIETAKANMVAPDGYESWHRTNRRETGLDPQAIATAWRSYERLKAATHQIDFDDLIVKAEAALRENPSFAQTIRWWYRHFYVDEFQDVNAQQIALLKQLVGEKPDLCVVGDPKQAIYTWNGAHPRLMLDLDQVFPGAAYRYLRANFRSVAEVVDLANAAAEGFADPAIARHGGVIHAKRPSGSPPRLHVFDSAEEEASFVARQIYASIANGAAPHSIAVLARTNLLLPQYQAALSARGIHNHVAGTAQIVSDSALKAATSHLRELLGPRGRLQDALTHLDDLIDEYKIDGFGGGAADSLAYFRQMAVEALRNEPRMDLTSFLNWFRVRAAESASASRNGVTLTTLHRAKGLEWDIVYLVAMEQGVLPHAKSTQPAAMEEEKRLFYVGITRARDHLYLTLARKRGKAERPASSFLSGLGALIQDGIPQKASTRRALEYIRAGKERLTTAEVIPLETDPVLETLKLWRRRRADDLGTAEETLLPDRAVHYLASNLPVDRDDLAVCPGVTREFLAEHTEALLTLLKALARARKARLPL